VSKFKNEFESHALGTGSTVHKKSTIASVPVKKLETV
jgi:hypothetical protein